MADEISPELVLVSPDLAVLARSRLGKPGEVYCGTFEPSRARAVSTSPATPPSSQGVRLPPLDVAQPGDQASRRTSTPRPARARARGRTVLVLGAIAGILAASAEVNGASSSHRPRVAPLTAMVALPRPQENQGRASSARSEQAEKSPAPLRVSTPPAQARGRASASAPPPTTGAAGRRLRWSRNAQASYFNLQVFRNGGKVFEVWPLESTVTLPASWVFQGRRYRLTVGTYEWYVWPGIGPRTAARYGPLLRQRSFAVRG